MSPTAMTTALPDPTPSPQPSKEPSRRWYDQWVALAREVLERLAALFRRPNFLIYLLVVLFVLGGLGTWCTYAAYHLGKVAARDVILSAATYVCAISFTGIADAVVDRDAQPSIRLLILTFGLASLVPIARWVFLLAVASETPLSPTTVDLMLWTLWSPIVWLLANARDARFAEYRPEAAAGGNPMQGI